MLDEMFGPDSFGDAYVNEMRDGPMSSEWEYDIKKIDICRLQQ